MMRLDLGCGPIKQDGFVGADRFALPGVNVVLDFDRPLPIASDSVDLLLASHSLEHTAELPFTIGEIYRICKHGAQVCILAPYAHQAINFANPYHHQAFNEHTPRFWTNAPDTLIEPDEYVHPHAGAWGLSESDQSRPPYDLRCVRMEFFYFPAYRGLPVAEQRGARKQFLDVCDQILYHLVVVKTPLGEDELRRLASQMDYYDPPPIAARRATEHIYLQAGQLQKLQAALEAREAELSESQTALTESQTALTKSQTALTKSQTALDLSLASLTQTQSAAEKLKAELAQAKGDTQIVKLELTGTTSELRSRTEQYAALERKTRALADELDLFRRRRLIRWAHRLTLLRPGFQVAPAFQRLVDDSLTFGGVRGFRLQPSINLQSVPFLAYRLQWRGLGLQGILLALIVDVPRAAGRLGIELISPENQIVFQLMLPFSQATEARPVRFDFPVVMPAKQGHFGLRVFAQEAATPVRLLEWQRYRLGGLWRLETRPCCGLVLDPTSN